MRSKPLAVLAGLAAGSLALAQNPIDATWVPVPPAAIAAVPQVPPPSNLQVGWTDNFDRPNNSVLGPDWTQQAGSMGIDNNQGRGTAMSNSWASHNSASLAYSNATASVDYLPSPAPGIIYVALIFGTGAGSDCIFMKVQDNSSAGNYNRVWFYRGINGSNGFFGSFPIASPHVSGRMTGYFTNAGNTANLDLDWDFNGTVDEHFEVSGLLAAGMTLGTGTGVGNYRDPAFDNWSFGDGQVTPPVAYCTSGTSSNGCVASISATAQPNVAHSTPCLISVANVPGQRSGIVFYGLVALPQPWCSLGGGSSFLCVKPPTMRTPPQNSAGSFGACDGTLALDWNAFQLANPGALGNPWSAGGKAYVQAWYRDPPSCKTTSMSDAVELTYQP